MIPAASPYVPTPRTRLNAEPDRRDANLEGKLSESQVAINALLLSCGGWRRSLWITGKGMAQRNAGLRQRRAPLAHTT